MSAPASTTFRHPCRGFSLVEQIMVLVIAALLGALAVPVMAHLVVRSASETAAARLMQAVGEARTDAIMHNNHVLLCPSLDGRTCDAGGHWEHGWIVALDRNHDHRADLPVLDTGHADPAQVRILASRGRRYLLFHANGSAAGTNQSLLICPRHPDDAPPRVLIVSNTGRPRLAIANHARAARCPSSFAS